MNKAGNRGVGVSKKDPFGKWMLIGIFVLFLAAAALHFVYEWSGKSIVAGLFAPVNESPWEHLKMTFWPMLVWWVAGYLIFLRNRGNGFVRAAVTYAVSALFSVVFVIAFFYAYTGALGVESLPVDIIGLFLSLLFGILLARHIDRHLTPGMFAAFIAVAVILLMAAAFLYYTFEPPHLPIFKDPPTGTYGI